MRLAAPDNVPPRFPHPRRPGCYRRHDTGPAVWQNQGMAGRPFARGFRPAAGATMMGVQRTMAFTGIELARVKKVMGGFCEGRTLSTIRNKLQEGNWSRDTTSKHRMPSRWVRRRGVTNIDARGARIADLPAFCHGGSVVGHRHERVKEHSRIGDYHADSQDATRVPCRQESPGASAVQGIEVQRSREMTP